MSFRNSGTFYAEKCRLVGPRPPVPYEFEMYDYWHRRRVFELKPGVTGLWQVNGRSRTCFDDMVRLDLRYSQTGRSGWISRSCWLLHSPLSRATEPTRFATFARSQA